MNTIIVQPKTKEEMQLVSDLLKKMRISSKVLTEEEREDIGLVMLMKQTDRSEKVPRNIIMEKLGRK
jgi:hypothetical protein